MGINLLISHDGHWTEPSFDFDLEPLRVDGLLYIARYLPLNS